MTYTLTHNSAFGSLEIRFPEVPTPAVRAALKTLRFRWHSRDRYWYGKADENALREQLDKLLSRAEKIAAANRRNAKTDRAPVAPSPKREPAPVYTLVSVSEPEPETAPEPDPVPAFPSLADLKPLSFSYRAGNASGQACLSLELLSSASAQTLKIVLPMLDGIEDVETRKNAFFTLAALAYYEAKDNPEKAPRFRQLSALYREKTGNDFPDPDTKTDGKPASPKTVTAAMKRICKGAPDHLKGTLSHDGWIFSTDGNHAVFLRSSAPDLAAADLPAENELAANFVNLLHRYEEQPHPGTLALPTVRELKAHIKCAEDGKTYSLDGTNYNAQFLLNILESLPGCTALRPAEYPNPIIFTNGEDRAILMPLTKKRARVSA